MHLQRFYPFFLAALLLIGVTVPLVPAQKDAPEYAPPPTLPEQLTGEDERQELLRMKSSLCKDLELEAGVIINTGILPNVPERIQEITGMPIHELEAKETQACSADPSQMTIAELRENVRTLEWLVRVHLAAMADVTAENPVLRPINAEGYFADIFELHDTIVLQMREHLRTLVNDPSMSAAKSMGEFFTNVIQPHAVAEDEVVWPLAKSLQDPGLTKSAELLLKEHRRIDEMIAAYTGSLARAEKGKAVPKQLVRQAQNISRRVELHFAKEEESVYRVLQDRLPQQEFRPVIVEQVEAIGPWLGEHGWESELSKK